MLKFLKYYLSTMVLFFLFSNSAFAQAGNGIDVTGILTDALLTIGAIVASIIGFYARKMFPKWIEQKHLETLDTIAKAGVGLAMQQLSDANGKVNLKVKSDVVKAAATYVVTSAPDALKHFGIDPTTDAGRNKIANMVAARLPAAVPADK